MIAFARLCFTPAGLHTHSTYTHLHSNTHLHTHSLTHKHTHIPCRYYQDADKEYYEYYGYYADDDAGYGDDYNYEVRLFTRALHNFTPLFHASFTLATYGHYLVRRIFAKIG